MQRKRLRLNVVQKFAAYLVGLSILPLLIVSIVSTRVSQAVLEEEASRYTAELVVNQRDYLELQLDQVESLLANLSGVEEIRTVLAKKNHNTDTFTHLATQAHIGYILNGYSNLNGLVSIDIFTVSGAHYHVGDTLDVSNIRQQVKDRIFNEALAENELVLWTGIEKNVNVNSKHEQVLTAAKVLYHVDRETLQQKPTALFLVNYSVEYLYDHFRPIDIGEGAYLMIVDAKDRVIYHPDKALLGATADTGFSQVLGEIGTHDHREPGQGLHLDIDGQEMVVSHAHIEQNDWTVVSLVPVQTLTAKTAAISRTTFLVLLLCFGCVAIFALIYNRDVVTPIRRVTSRFQQFQNGTLDAQTRLPVRGQDEISDLTKWFNSFMDSLAARQASENALRESEARNRALLQAIPDLMFVQDKDGVYLDYQASAPEQLLLPPAQFMGKSMHDVLPPELARPLADFFTLALATGEIQFHNYALELNGETHHFEARIVAYGEDKLLTIIRDVTERVRSENALRQAQKLESLGILAGGIAHDFNNLLVAILAQSSLAAHKLDPETAAHEHVNKVIKAAERAAELTRQMLAYSGRGNFEVQPLNLNDLILENLHLFEVAVPKNVMLKSALADSLPQVEADIGQMQQVIMNLIINGAEAMNGRAGVVTVRTKVEQLDPENAASLQHISAPILPGRYVTLQVEDNGCGMDEATITKIFDPFFTTKFTGRGLGLAAVLGIVKGHKGGISVQSEVGDGTTFTIYLPASQRQTNQQAAPTQSAENGHQKSSTVLAIDDETAVHEAIIDILAMEDIQTLTAANGEEGIEIYKKRQAEINLIILDLSMPGLSGEETYAELRKINPEAPVLLSSGYSQKEINIRFADQGIRGFLQKPYSITTLLHTVQEHLN